MAGFAFTKFWYPRLPVPPGEPKGAGDVFAALFLLAVVGSAAAALLLAAVVVAISKGRRARVAIRLMLFAPAAVVACILLAM